MNWKALFLLVMTAGFLGCKDDRRKDFLLGREIAPPAQGVWKGNLSINGTSSPVQLTVDQSNINLKGSYETGNAALENYLGSNGSIEGVTTGPTVSFKLLPENDTCGMLLQLGGGNSGPQMDLSLTGFDCDGQTLRGQTTLAKS